jgi:hypothetical protein
LKALFKNHVYEEVAYEIYELQNKHQNIGLGRVGEFENALSESDFLQLVKEKYNVKVHQTFCFYLKINKKSSSFRRFRQFCNSQAKFP